METSLKRPSVLLVDDCQDTLSVLRFLFESSGAEVFTATSGNEALSFITEGNKEAKTQKFQLVVLDIRMPEMQGDELAQHIRSGGFTGKIVALTASASGHGREKSLGVGINVYLGKSSMKKEVASALVAEAQAMM